MKAKIYIHPEFGDVSIILYQDLPNGRRAIVKPTALVFQEIEPGIKIEPTLSLFGLDAQEFLQTFSDEAKNMGIRSKQDEINEGELKATKFHLEDLRKLLKLK